MSSGLFHSVHLIKSPEPPIFTLILSRPHSLATDASHVHRKKGQRMLYFLCPSDYFFFYLLISYLQL